MTERFDISGGSIEFRLSALINLLLHTLNMYDLLGGHGRQYALRSDAKALAAVGSDIYTQIAGHDRYFTAGSLNFFDPTMQVVVTKEVYRVHPDKDLLLHIAPPPLNEALKRMWTQFYEAYWQYRHSDLAQEFQEMCSRQRWMKLLSEMEACTGQRWHDRVLIFPVEATAESALHWGGYVCIGTLHRGGDAGFTHEGLHLLLKEQWAASPAIQHFMAARKFHDANWTSWSAMYEQALVVGLSACLTGSSEEKAQRYFMGCGVGHLFETTWPLVKEHMKGRRDDLNRLMLEVVQCGEQSRGVVA